VQDSFYEDLERVFGKFLKYHMKIMVRHFNAKVGKEDIFKPAIWNEYLHEIRNLNSGRVHPVASVYDKTRQSRCLTRNYLFSNFKFENKTCVVFARE
jgi:hypothetical protein